MPSSSSASGWPRSHGRPLFIYPPTDSEANLIPSPLEKLMIPIDTESQTRTAYRDPRDRVEITSVAIAAHLVLAGFQLLQVVMLRGKPHYLFDLNARVELERLRFASDELEATRERAVSASRRYAEQRS